jgi:hypothetical protein
MSAPQHTPGPWRVEKDGSAEHHNEANVINGADGTLIVYGQVGDADARLIAAAPEMLEALNEIASWGDGEVGPHMDEPDAAHIARTAIAKVTGIKQ